MRVWKLVSPNFFFFFTRPNSFGRTQQPALTTLFMSLLSEKLSNVIYKTVFSINSRNLKQIFRFEVLLDCEIFSVQQVKETVVLGAAYANNWINISVIANLFYRNCKWFLNILSIICFAENLHKKEVGKIRNCWESYLSSVRGVHKLVSCKFKVVEISQESAGKTEIIASESAAGET